jgi:hypothetical protein
MPELGSTEAPVHESAQTADRLYSVPSELTSKKSHAILYLSTKKHWPI